MGRGTLVVSLRARGLAAFNAPHYFDVRHHALAITTEVWDLIISTVITGFHLSWSAWVSILITIVAVAVSVSDSSWINQVSVPRDEKDEMYVVTDASTSVAYVIMLLGSVFLPLYALLAMVWLRRSSALASMAKLKAHVVGIVLSAGGGDVEGAIVQRAMGALMDDLHRCAPCSAMRRHAAPCSAMQRHAAPCSAMQRHAAPCSAMRHAAGGRHASACPA
jgi:hypothetical protein